MDDNWKIFLKESKKYKNSLVLNSSFGVGIQYFLGVTDQFPEDYYYVVYDFGRKEVILESCVSKMIFLKSSLKKKEYKYLEKILQLNYNLLEILKKVELLKINLK